MEKQQLCAMTKEPIRYNKYWDYYEKPPRAAFSGLPQDVGYEKKWDHQRRESKHFWKEFQYEKTKNDKRKLLKLKNEVEQVAHRADTLEAKLRAAESSYTNAKIQSEQLVRSGKTQAHGLRAANKELVAAEGEHKEAKLTIKILNGQIQHRQKEILDEDPEYEESGKDFNDDAKIQYFNEQLVEHRKTAQEKYARVVATQQDYDDVQHALQENDKKQVEAVTQSKTLEEDIKAMKTELKLLAVKALELQKVLAKEEELSSPPPGEMDPPSLDSTRSWDQKANEAEAKANIFFMSPGEKRLLKMKEQAAAKAGAEATKGEDEAPEL